MHIISEMPIVWLSSGERVNQMTLTHSPDFEISKAINGVVIDHAHGLHKGVNDGRTDEAEAPFLQIFANPL